MNSGNKLEVIGLSYKYGTFSFITNKVYVPWLYDKISKINIKMKYVFVRYTYLYYVSVWLFAKLYSYVAPLVLEFFVREQFVGVLNGMHTKHYGVLGTSYCVELSYLIVFVLVWYTSEKIYRMLCIDEKY